MEQLKKIGSLIDNEIVFGPQQNVYSDINPANGQVISQIYEADTAMADKVIASAQRAFASWRKTPRAERGRILRAMAERMVEHRDYLLEGGETIETGRPLIESAIHVDNAIAIYRYFALAIEVQEEQLVSCSGSFSNIVREPLGVAGLISSECPHNACFLEKLAPALATGNCAIIKPASNGALPVSAAALLWTDLLPPGVLNILVGSGSIIGDYLINHPSINKLSFTGSTAVGRMVGVAAAQNIIPCTLELGGKVGQYYL